MQDDVMPTVLVVDDAADTRQLLNETLKPHCVVLLAKNGEQALERARSKQPDLILLDVVMPGMSGFEVLSNLQSDATTRDIPVIFLTGMDSDADVERGLQYGAVDYIRKPFVREVVVARSMQHARRAQQARQLGQSMVHSDSATGLPNREALLDKMATECRRSSRVGSHFALLLLDFRNARQQLLTAQFDGILAATALGASKVLADWVPWVARSRRQGVCLVLPDIQDAADGAPQERVPALVARAAQDSGFDPAMQWRVVLGYSSDVQCEDMPALLATLETQLDAAPWQSLPNPEVKP
jgi:CheY-like chemotaxis protein